MTNREALEAFTRVEVATVDVGTFVIALPVVQNDKGNVVSTSVKYGFFGVGMNENRTAPDDEVFADLLVFLKGKRLIVQDGESS